MIASWMIVKCLCMLNVNFLIFIAMKNCWFDFEIELLIDEVSNWNSKFKFELFIFWNSYWFVELAINWVNSWLSFDFLRFEFDELINVFWLESNDCESFDERKRYSNSTNFFLSTLRVRFATKLFETFEILIKYLIMSIESFDCSKFEFMSALQRNEYVW